MSHEHEIPVFLRTWEQEAQNAIRTMESISADKYDFRPDPKGRSIGEMAWHLCEIDGCTSYGVVERRIRKLQSALSIFSKPRHGPRLDPFDSFASPTLFVVSRYSSSSGGFSTREARSRYSQKLATASD